MYIAPGVHVSKWRALDLDQAPDAEDWSTAREIFCARISDRYLDPVDLLVEHEAKTPALARRFGFTILAIDCLLVETLQAFRWGRADTKGKSKRAFRTFLTERERFAPHFSSAKADQFYNDYRCGILHQAEVGGTSKVWSVGALVQDGPSGMIVNRTLFHRYLKDEVNLYIQDLATPDQVSLRTAFRKKMDHVGRVQ